MFHAVALTLRALALRSCKLKFDRFRLLRGMRMLVRNINLQSVYKALAQLILWKHAQHRFPNELLGLRFKNLASLYLSKTAWIQRVMAINLLIEFLAGQFDFLGIHDDDMVATDQERGILRSVLSA